MFRDIIDFYNEKAPKNLALGFDTALSTIATSGILLVFAYGLARISTSLFNELRNAIFAKVAQRSIRSIAHRIFLHLHSLDLSFHLNRQTGALAKAIDRGTRGMNFTLNAMVFNVLPTAFEMALVGTIFHLRCGPEFTAWTMGCLGMYGVATIGITRWRTRYRHQMNEAENEAGNREIDSLINYETVKYFNNERLEADRFDHFLKKYEIASLKTTSTLALLNFIQSTIFSCGLIAVMCLAVQNVQNGVMTVGDIVLVNTLLFQMSIPLNFLGSVYREVRQGLQDMQTMFSLLDLKSKIIELPNAPALLVSKDQSTIEFKDVTFGYIPNKPPILQNLSFTVPSGKKVALVGGSGSGKSTIVRLLYRLYDADAGTISINGQKVEAVQLEGLRKAIAVVPQEPVLFHDTLFYNIQYGNPSASMEQVIEVAKLADIHKSISHMPAGYETMVGERGLKLSGGEKQRIAIARAILKNTPIMIYDEATSSLDALTEENIMKSLKKACSGMTSLFIAHRLATIVDADIIYVLDKGSVVESGTHSELIQNPNGKYFELWNSQHRFGSTTQNAPKKMSMAEEELLLIEFDKCCGSSNCTR
ncbi:ABC transporter domain-containing protein [Ditylenchus destructor]|uniref:Iron-sulfur clusters transporter ABCB7, mitochondrial n=1 Tax=Ditylenchus destructor TaxID=166010 RepID=A0AAD4N5U6_9BILA|nr:ABC transporter domain-containing protein [Ditylenchus destructor]